MDATIIRDRIRGARAMVEGTIPLGRINDAFMVLNWVCRDYIKMHIDTCGDMQIGSFLEGYLTTFEGYLSCSNKWQERSNWAAVMSMGSADGKVMFPMPFGGECVCSFSEADSTLSLLVADLGKKAVLACCDAITLMLSVMTLKREHERPIEDRVGDVYRSITKLASSPLANHLTPEFLAYIAALHSADHASQLAVYTGNDGDVVIRKLDFPAPARCPPVVTISVENCTAGANVTVVGAGGRDTTDMVAHARSLAVETNGPVRVTYVTYGK